MDDQREPDPVDLDKDTGIPVVPPAPSGIEPTWHRGPRGGLGGGRGGGGPVQHLRASSGRWWECWELDHIRAEIDYWALPWFKRIRRPRPPELRNHTAAEQMSGAPRTYLHHQPPIHRRLLELIRR